MSGHPTRHELAAVAGGAVLLAADLALGLGGALVTTWVDNLSQLIAPAIAAAVLVAAARRSSGRLRVSQAALAAGCSAWTAGQSVWCWYELIERVEAPFPSAADVGFLLFPVGAVVALLVYPTGALRPQRRMRTLLDGAIAATALLLVSWIAVLGSVWRTSSGGALGVSVSLAYPFSDVLLIALALLVLSRAGPRHRTQLLWLAAGLCSMSVADSAFVYLTATNDYGTHEWLDTAWVAAFAMMAVAGRHGRSRQEPGALPAIDGEQSGAGTVTAEPAAGRVQLVLPYLPLPIAAWLTATEVAFDRATAGDLFLTAGLAVLVICRQFLMLGENRSLLVTVRRREEQLRHQAFHDPLTGLANRSLFVDRVNHAVDLQQRDLRTIGVIFLDLDGFKQINDGLGHAAGDAVLRGTADRLRACLRAGDTIARFGGDEFAILVEDDLVDPATTAHRVLAGFERPFVLDGRSHVVRASIGVVTVSPDRRAPAASELLRRADLAMYVAKRAGGAAVRVFDTAMTVGLADPVLPAELRQAVERREIHVVYQQVRAVAPGASSDPVLVEALARWDHATRGPVPPALFIPMAEEHGLIGALGDQVLSTAVFDAAGWIRRNPGRPIAVSVNLSPRQLGDPGLPDRVAALLAESGLPAHQLVLEITETCVLSDEPPVPDVLRRLSALGIRMALDDFGSGYSNLANLRRARLHVLKLDKSLVDHLEESADDRLFLGAVVSFAHRLGIEVIAEGCERESQLEVLRALDCDLVQGFLYSRPGPTFGADPVLPGLPATALAAAPRAGRI